MPRILMINDDLDLLEICRMTLEGGGHQVETLAHAQRGPLVQLLESFRPDVILLDLVMPIASGEEVMGWLREEPVSREIPVVVMSASANAEQVAEELAADGFIPKPFTDDELLGAVGRLFEGLPEGASP